MTKIITSILTTTACVLVIHISMAELYGPKLCLDRNNSIHFAHSSLHTIAYDLSNTGSIRYIRGEIKKYGVVGSYVYGYLDITNDDLEGLREPKDRNGYFIITLLHKYTYSTNMENQVVSGLDEKGFLKAMKNVSDKPVEFSNDISENQWWRCVWHT